MHNYDIKSLMQEKPRMKKSPDRNDIKTIKPVPDVRSNESLSKPVNWKMATLNTNNPKWDKKLSEPDGFRGTAQKSARQQADKYNLPGQMSKGSAGRASAEAQRDGYARTAIKTGLYKSLSAYGKSIQVNNPSNGSAGRDSATTSRFRMADPKSQNLTRPTADPFNSKDYKKRLDASRSINKRMIAREYDTGVTATGIRG